MKANLEHLAVAIMLHELGHFEAHAPFGYEVNRLWYAGVTTGETPAFVLSARQADSVLVVSLDAWLERPTPTTLTSTGSPGAGGS